MRIVTEHAPAEHVLVHVSDTHFTGSGLPLYGAVDSDERFAAALQGLVDSGQRVEALIFTGDLADDGEPEAYRRLREAVEPAAQALGAEVIWAMGNHDSRAAFREGLLGQGPGEEPVDAVYEVNGLRIVVLDTTVPGSHHGELSEHQLAWLGRVLEHAAPHGTVIAMHHPPTPVIQPLSQLVELRGQRAFADVVRDTDVRSILAGHLHYSSSATCAGIPVSVASATCYTQDLVGLVGPDGVRGTRGRDAAQAYNLVHVFEDTVVHTVVPAGGGASVGEEVGPEEVSRRLTAAGLTPREPRTPGD